MAQIIQLGQPPIDVTVKYSSRARRISLRISGVDGRVSLTVPRFAKNSDAQSFLRDKEGWIRKHLEQQPDQVLVQPGAFIPIEGVSYRIEVGSNRAVSLQTNCISVPPGLEKTGPRLRAFLKTLARDRLAEASGRYAAKLGRRYGKITLRDTRSRWGSCTCEGNLMYSWRLILAPPAVLDYVAVHECCHLVEMNHSKAFWDLVEGLMPDYNAPRRWLRKEGGALHRYQFDAP
ncbi:MAG: SprT family zinc-dependent metalloprotease [Litoreibacter sp.]|nr:SprT family zinc-dependent metalloprotease [Litoreibacter sp.]